MRVSPFVAETVFRDCPHCHVELTFDRKPLSLRVGMTITCGQCKTRFDVCACGAASSPARCRRCVRLLFEKDIGANNDILAFDKLTYSEKGPSDNFYVRRDDKKFAEIARHLELSNRAILEIYTRMVDLEAKVIAIPRKLDEIIETLKFMPPSRGTEYVATESSFKLGAENPRE